jgi:hypothetical protein
VEKKPRLAKRGDVHEAQTFLFLEKVFEGVMSFACETFDLVESRAIVFRHASRADRIDFLVTVQKLAAKHLSRKLHNQFRRQLTGGEIGAGSRRMLVASLASEFIKAELFPRSRWFSGSGWAEAQRKKQQTLSISMTPSQIKATADAQFINPSRDRRWHEETGAPLIVAENWEPTQEPEAPIVTEFMDVTSDAFAAQELSI